MEKQRKMEKSWELLKLCREVMKEEGHSWKVSKERREEERTREMEKHERLRRAAGQREKTLEKAEDKKKQLRITENLGKLPENRRILLEGRWRKREE